MSFVRIARAEVAKLRRSLVLLLVGAVPTMVLVLLLCMRLSGHGAPDWSRHALGGAAMWATFLLPLTATALYALLAQTEHATRAWSDVLALPYPRWKIFVAKAALGAMVMAAISVLLWIAVFVAGVVADAASSQPPLAGTPPLADVALVLLRMWIAGWLVMAIQFAVAMRFANFAAPIVTGIAGTFFAVAATSAKAGVYFPWLLPVNMLAADPARAAQALWLGGAGGLVALAIGCVWLGRRDWH